MQIVLYYLCISIMVLIRNSRDQKCIWYHHNNMIIVLADIVQSCYEI